MTLTFKDKVDKLIDYRMRDKDIVRPLIENYVKKETEYIKDKELDIKLDDAIKKYIYNTHREMEEILGMTAEEYVRQNKNDDIKNNPSEGYIGFYTVVRMIEKLMKKYNLLKLLRQEDKKYLRGGKNG